MSSDHGGGGGGRGGRKRGNAGGEAEHADERWLLTYADMITLLMALFIVMWAISSVNTSKFNALRDSLREAFNGKLMTGGEGTLSGGTSILQPDGARIASVSPPRESPPSTQSNRFMPTNGIASFKAPVGSAQAEQQNLEKLARQIQNYAKQHGLASKIGATVDERGVIIRLLTDKVLFDPGSSDLKTPAVPLIRQVGMIVEKLDVSNPIRVEGNTDNTPIATARFHSNWELSTARATSVLQVLLQAGIEPARFSAAGYADTRPVASNSDELSRYMNRHVDIVVLRSDGGTSTIASIP